MNSMFGKHKEPLSSSERIKNKRNLAIYNSLTSSKNKKNKKNRNVCLDHSGNVRNAINYETYMNTVNGFYESIKKNSKKNVFITINGAKKNIDYISQTEFTNAVTNNTITDDDQKIYNDYISNSNCFNVYLNDDTDSFIINTFDDVNNSFIDFDNNEKYSNEEFGIDVNKTWASENGGGYIPSNNIDKGFVAHSTVDISSNPLSNVLKTGTIEHSSKIVYPYEKKGDCAKLVVPKLTFFDPNNNSTVKVARDIKYFFPMSKLNKYKDMCNKTQ